MRLHGGYRDFSGNPVFDLTRLEEMRKHLEPGVSGWFTRAELPKRQNRVVRR
jgi:hypothetical protein